MDELCLQRGMGKKVGLYTFKHPTLGEIADYGEKVDSNDYFQMLFSLIMNSKDLADVLWIESKIWYEDLESEWIFFIQRVLSGAQECLINIESDSGYEKIQGLSVGEKMEEALNFFLQTEGTWMLFEKKKEDEKENQIIIINLGIENIWKEDNLKFTEYHYNLLVEYLKQIHWIKIEYDFVKGGNRATKEYMFKNMYKNRKRNKTQNITLASINSSIIAKGVNVSTWDLPIYMVYDLYYRHVKIDEYKNTMSALYAGAIDTTKNPINWEKINWSSVFKL